MPEDGLSSTSTVSPWRGAGSGPRPNPVTLCLGGSLGRLRRVVNPLSGCCRLCASWQGRPGLGVALARHPRPVLAATDVARGVAGCPFGVQPALGRWTPRTVLDRRGRGTHAHEPCRCGDAGRGVGRARPALAQSSRAGGVGEGVGPIVVGRVRGLPRALCPGVRLPITPTPQRWRSGRRCV